MTSNWDGVGLPPAARARLERAKDTGVATSLLSVNGQVGLDACGFVPVGEVMGCLVMHIGFSGYGGCGWVWGAPPMTTMLSRSGGYGGFRPYLDAVESGWYGALTRMLSECASIGGDGVVAVQLTETDLGEGNREYLAMGTAVRSLGPTRPARPFSTTLSGPDVAKLFHAGYMPFETIVAVSVGVRHDDYFTLRATQYGAGNIEVPGYTELVHAVRADARSELGRRVTRSGADGAVLTTPLSIRVHELEVAEGHRDHFAIASLVGAAIVRFSEKSTHLARPLSILPLSSFTKEHR